MKITLPYDKNDQLEAEIDDKYIAGFVEANDVVIGDESKTIQDAIKNPFNSSSLKEFLSDAKDVLFIVNDATRPTPTSRVIDFIYDDFKDKDFKFIIATGVHRAPTEEEYVQIFGDYYKKFRDRIFAHDARKDEDMVFLGKSKNGTEMLVNKMGVDAHKIVIISSVEPHYFAGYTGGRKSFLPGIASFKTIEQNHKLALSADAKALVLEGNPVHEDMIDALKSVDKEIFCIMTVLNKNHKIYAATAGYVNDSFMAAIDKADEVFAAKIKEKADVVVSLVKFPQDIDLYQAQKGIDNAKLALKENGILLLVAKCRCGIGGETFANLLSSCDSPKESLQKIDKEFKLGYHKAAKMSEIGLWAEMWGVTGIESDVLAKLFIRPFASLQEALDAAIEKKGADAKILFLMDGGLIVPKVEQ